MGNDKTPPYKINLGVPPCLQFSSTRSSDVPTSKRAPAVVPFHGSTCSSPDDIELGYADDLLLLDTSQHQVSRLLADTELALASISLGLNPRKCQLIASRTRLRAQAGIQTSGGHIIGAADGATYL